MAKVTPACWMRGRVDMKLLLSFDPERDRFDEMVSELVDASMYLEGDTITGVLLFMY